MLVSALLTALGAVLTTWPLASHLGSATLRSGEVLLTAWQLNWYHQALLTNPLAWADANIFFPYANTAAFNDLLMSHALITVPVAWAESPVLALNLALLGGIVLCGVCACLLIVELVDEPWAGAVGGVLFALTPYRFLQLGHLSIAAAWPIPLFFWALLRHLRRPSWKAAGLVAVTGILVGLSSLYHAAYVAPIVPLALLAGARRGPGDRQVWVPLALTSLPALALLAWFFAPFAVVLGSYGTAAAPNDLLTYGADLSSVTQKPDYLDAAAADSAINTEAHLYPGAGLAWLAAAGLLVSLWSVRTWRGRMRHAAVATIALAAAVGLGFVVPLPAPLREIWKPALLAMVWIGPPILMLWALAGTRAATPFDPPAAMRVGLAGAAIALVLALGPEARYLGTPIGPAPYWLLTQLSAAFEGTRVPARFGSVALLFLAVVAGAVLALLFRAPRRAGRVAGAGLGLAALVACAVQLPLPALPSGHDLVSLPALQDPVYAWLADRPGRFGILELPDWPADAEVDYRVREWRSLRHMLASKQHGQALVNGSGRVEPFLWQRFRWLEPWTDEFFTYVTAYFPVDYVLVHEGGIPASVRGAVWDRLSRGADGWRELYRSPQIRVYTIDRSFARGSVVDRLALRRDLAPLADIRYEARVPGQPDSPAGTDRQLPIVLELLRDGDPAGECLLTDRWQTCEASVPVAADAGDRLSEWPKTTTLLRWRVRGHPDTVFELRGLRIGKAGQRID